MKKLDAPIIIEQDFHATLGEVWYALTELDQMKAWFFDNIPDFQPIVGFKTQFVIQNENRIFTHLWEITEVIPHQKITYNWKYEEYPGDSYVTFSLMKMGNQVRLNLKVEVVEDFPSDIPEFKRESGIGGWNYFVKGQLKSYLEG